MVARYRSKFVYVLFSFDNLNYRICIVAFAYCNFRIRISNFGSIVYFSFAPALINDRTEPTENQKTDYKNKSHDTELGTEKASCDHSSGREQSNVFVKRFFAVQIRKADLFNVGVYLFGNVFVV